MFLTVAYDYSNAAPRTAILLNITTVTAVCRFPVLAIAESGGYSTVE